MRKPVKLTCFDCNLPIGGTPNLVLRKNPCGAGVVRVNVCRRHTGQKPERVSELAEQRAKYAQWMMK
jgi:hypothetical protein